MKRLFARVSDETLLRVTLCALFVALLIGYFAPNIFISIPAGHAGVLWSRFFGGTVTTKVYGEGMHVFFPWDQITLYDARAQQLSEQVDSITNDGLHVTITMVVRYHPVIGQLGILQRDLGPDYVHTVIAPNVSAFLRQQVARFSAEEVYSAQRSYIERVVLDYMRLNRLVVTRSSSQGVRFVNYDAVLISSVVLPPMVQKAIERKVAQREAVNEWSYRIQREELESRRREIEAEGTRQVLATLGEKLSDTFVRLRYVEMLGALAEGNATKMIVTAPGGAIPGLVVNADSAAPSPQPAPQAVPQAMPPAAGPRHVPPLHVMPPSPGLPTRPDTPEAPHNSSMPSPMPSPSGPEASPPSPKPPSTGGAP